MLHAHDSETESKEDRSPFVNVRGGEISVATDPGATVSGREEDDLSHEIFVRLSGRARIFRHMKVRDIKLLLEDAERKKPGVSRYEARSLRLEYVFREEIHGKAGSGARELLAGRSPVSVTSW
jgi:hypothetical protein